MQPARTRRRRRRGLAAAGVVVAAVASVGGLIAAADATGAARGGGAAAFLPADGAVSWSARPDGTVAQWEEALIPGLRGAFELPAPLTSAVLGGYADADDDALHWASLSDAAAARDGVTAREVRLLSDAGIRLVGSVGGEVDVGFAPGLLVLPADVRDGATWSSEGAATLALLGEDGSPSYGVFDYTAEFSAHAPSGDRWAAAAEPGCLQSESLLTLSGDSGDIEIEGVDLWCPGRGVVASANDGGVTLPAEAPERGVPDISTTAPVWTDPVAWSARTLGAVWDDPLWEDPEVTLSPSVAPAAMGDRLVVDDTSGDVIVLRPDGDRLVVVQRLHPGGRVLALSAGGDLLVVSTAERRVVAYDGDGARLWTRSLPDLVYAPVVVAADGLAVAGLDGTLRLLDPTTGEDLWSTPVSGAGLERVAVGAGVVVVADQTGGLVALAAPSGAERWQAEADEAYSAFAPADDVLLAATGATVEAYDLATGEQIWQTDAGASVSDLDVLGATALATAGAGVVALDIATGDVAPRNLPDAERVVADGTWALVEGGGAVRLVDRAGAVTATWPVPAESLGSFRALVAAGDVTWVVDSRTGVVRVAP